MKIGGYLTTSLVEWPGKIVAVVWTIGCNFRCPFCYNSHLVVGPFPQLIKEKQIFSDLKDRQEWLDGVAITGGEPTLQSDLADFCRQVKELDLGVMVETNGSRPEAIGRLISKDLVDFWAVDYKTSWDQYSDLVGFRGSGLVAKIKESLELILSSGRPVEIRTTVVPRIHSQERLVKMAQDLAAIVSRYRPEREKVTWRWQNFQPTNNLDIEYQKEKPYSERQLADLGRSVNSIFPLCYD